KIIGARAGVGGKAAGVCSPSRSVAMSLDYRPLLLSPLGLIPLGLPGADAQPVNRNTPTTYAPTWAGFYAGLNFGLNSDQARPPGPNPPLGAFPNSCSPKIRGGKNSPAAPGV